MISKERFWSDPCSCFSRGQIKKNRIYVAWIPLIENCLKFNIDGSAIGKPGPIGCGGILQNERGTILALFFGPLGIMDSNVAEVMAIKETVEMFVRSS
ncbi:hypothetical protein CRYUN_Cryun06bG0137300 [Craigia yunnanensis]